LQYRHGCDVIRIKRHLNSNDDGGSVDKSQLVERYSAERRPDVAAKIFTDEPVENISKIGFTLANMAATTVLLSQ
jgi:hypothetical protein